MSEESTFKVGDVVRLKSGGPPMTVCCEWEHNKGDLVCGRFDGVAFQESIYSPDNLTTEGIFMVGDKVKLRSGGPAMTISKVYPTYETKNPWESFECIWPEEGVGTRGATFSGCELVKVES
jgi:uncharacterized protein YodC (DUF2158 family)